MEKIEFPKDFKEFLRLLTTHNVEFLIVGGFAVAYHGYPRATADMDIWISRSRENAERIVQCLHEFGFESSELDIDFFMVPDRVVRMGIAPQRLEILTDIDGVSFFSCIQNAEIIEFDDVRVPVIGLDDLKLNKRASGRAKDLDDLENLP